MEIRDRVLAVMKRLASQKGFRAVTTDELAVAAGVSKRTLYQHFSSKDEIVEQVVDAMLQGIDARVQEIFALPLSPPEKLQAIVRAVAENVRFLEPYFFPDLQRYYPHLWEKIERFRAERMARLEQIYLDGCRRGYFKEFNVEVLMNCFMASVRPVINPAFLTSHNISLPRALDTLVEIFLYGISKPMS